MIDGHALVLNRSFSPIQITSIKRAICLVFKGLAYFVDENYQKYDFNSWAELSIKNENERIQLTSFSIRLPRVVILNFYDKLPQAFVRLCRENIYLRDKNTCQYCSKRFNRSELNIDHVVPISQGGETSWQNLVCSCVPCNQKKGGRTPEQARMPLLKKPSAPHHSLFMHVLPRENLFDAWHIYMNPLDFAYWRLELKR